jgi:hypothetical protein
MSNEHTAVKPNLDVPAGAGRVHRQAEGAINANNQAGGEVKRERYTNVGAKR